jgi:hypothetical protein
MTIPQERLTASFAALYYSIIFVGYTNNILLTAREDV